MTTRTYHHHLRLNKFLMAMLFFTAAYMVTINIGNAQQAVNAPADGVQVGENGNVVINGRITEVRDGAVTIVSAGKEMKVDLKNIDLNTNSKAMFKNNMNVTITGSMNGDDFGVPIVDATSITATEPSAVKTTGTAAVR